jgi:2-polyprenyl-3-methyl-5-hydroxy-6-metoxy-1,4-benzoquinol methylase
MDKAKLDAFWHSRLRVPDARLATNFRNDGRLQDDLEFVTRHLPPGAQILDLGAGTCTLSTKLLDRVHSVVAVDKYAEFLDRVAPHPRMRKVQADVVDFTSLDRFDVILLFGVVNSLDTDEEAVLYAHCREMLAPDGVFLVKHQCGIRETVMIDNYSEEIGGHYYARYPAVDEQTALLRRYFDVEVAHIYNDTINRWPSTRFFTFLCRSNAAT